jgi:hypothetical protein
MSRGRKNPHSFAQEVDRNVDSQAAILHSDVSNPISTVVWYMYDKLSLVRSFPGIVLLVDLGENPVADGISQSSRTLPISKGVGGLLTRCRGSVGTPLRQP